jgi:2-keto-4-pentenoate hydratase/2-oxohepta-3-ene-1,7-dioic acid hydratase in catechol pathway
MTNAASDTISTARFLWHNEIETGVVEGNQIVALISDISEEGTPAHPLARLDQVKLLPPCQPHNIVCIGRNYREHAAETGAEVPSEPLIFLKPTTSLIAHGDPIIYPSWVSQHVDHEGELAVVIGRTCWRVSEDEALEYVLGYTIGNDVTARDLQRKDGQWTRGKGFNTFCPLGPVLVEGIDASDLAIQTRVNGVVKQSARTSELIFPLPRLISHISQVMTLQYGDVILTGTPAGISPMQPGDVVEVEIEGIGILRNPIVAGE